MMFYILIASCFGALYADCSNSQIHSAVMSTDACSKLTPNQALIIGHRAIEKHFKIKMNMSDLLCTDKGDYYFITVKIDESALGGGVSAKVDAYSGEVIDVFFSE